MLDKIKWKFHWNKTTILKGTAIAAVPLLGISAFLGFWFIQPEDDSVPTDPPIANEFVIEDTYWYSNSQIFVDYKYSGDTEAVEQVTVEYGYDGVYTTDDITTDNQDSYFILDDAPQEADVSVDVTVEYLDGSSETEETEWINWEDNPGYNEPKPDDPDYIPGNPMEPSDPEDPVGIKDPLVFTPINPISTVEFYPATTSQGVFNQTYIETILISNFEDMIDYSETGISPNSEYDLYYELVDPYTLNVMVVESIDGQVLNETKFTYSIV